MKYMSVKKLFKHIIYNQTNFKVIQYQEGFLQRVFILSDGIVHIKRIVYNNFDDDIEIKNKDEYIFGYKNLLYNPKYIKVDRCVKNIINNRTDYYEIAKHKFNSWEG